MQQKENKAVESFLSGKNCAQSVLAAFADELNFDSRLALEISSSFGGGMGRLQEKCGAVTGAFMAIGIYCSRKFGDEAVRKEKINSMVQEFDRKFKEINGSSECSVLMNCNLNTEEGIKYSNDNDLRNNVCAICVSGSVKLLSKMLV